MILSISTQLDYALAGPTDVLLQIEAAAMPDQRILSANIILPEATGFARIPAEEGVGDRVWLSMHGRMQCSYEASVEITRRAEDLTTLRRVPPHQLPAYTIRYLMASRFCPSDEFQSFVAAEFGQLGGGAAIAAMRDWIEDRFTYVPGASHARTTALDTFVQRKGVCRDFAHVLITLARAAAIPARIVSVYAPALEPQDFHAVAEVWLEGAEAGWHLVDPTGMADPTEMARIAVGRDAADVAFMTSYGQADLMFQSVNVQRG